MARYFPPRSISIPWRALIQRWDPDYEKDKRDQVEFQFSNGRQFKHNPETRGPYADED
jgi:hypothetical protein